MWKSKRGKIFVKREMVGSIKCAIKYGKEKEKRDEFLNGKRVYAIKSGKGKGDILNLSNKKTNLPLELFISTSLSIDLHSD